MKKNPASPNEIIILIRQLADEAPLRIAPIPQDCVSEEEVQLLKNHPHL